MRKGRQLSEAEIDRHTELVRAMVREHPECAPRKIGEYVNLIVQGCRAQDPFLVDMGHVSLQALGLELVAQLTAAKAK